MYFMLMANGASCVGHKMCNVQCTIPIQSSLHHLDHIHMAWSFQALNNEENLFWQKSTKGWSKFIFICCVSCIAYQQRILFHLLQWTEHKYYSWIAFIWLLNFRRCLWMPKINVHIVFVFCFIYCHAFISYSLQLKVY